MKIVTLITMLLLSFNYVEAASKSTTKTRGWRESYGGDSNVSEFQNIAYEIFSSIDQNVFSKITKKPKNTIMSIISNAKLGCETNLNIDGISKEAINYPFENPKRIEIDCDKWKQMMPSSRYLLVAHEYLHLSLINDSSYIFSNQLIKVFLKNKESTSPYSKDLVASAADCNLQAFKLAISRGANIYFRDDGSINALDGAISSGCYPIVIELIKLGAPIDEAAKRSLTERILNDVFKIEQLSDFQRTKVIQTEFIVPNLDDTVKILRALVSIDTNLVDYQITLPNNIDFYHIFDFKSKYITDFPSCLKGSTVLHLVAYEVVKNSEDPLMQSYGRSVLDSLVSTGFNLEVKNNCNISPSDILRGF